VGTTLPPRVKFSVASVGHILHLRDFSIQICFETLATKMAPPSGKIKKIRCKEPIRRPKKRPNSRQQLKKILIEILAKIDILVRFSPKIWSPISNSLEGFHREKCGLYGSRASQHCGRLDRLSI